ncbi:hypothetical protein EYF80_064756 [Liparis tanakae]|uniref:Uncharacterized protein n=1 Tax=Liparis tanakae TaxID=230148 RepID=A0A4Z2E8I1_9TELE|nr:hypothetical protein EYF80_064756 [Liparis tanakae]
MKDRRTPFVFIRISVQKRSSVKSAVCSNVGTSRFREQQEAPCRALSLTPQRTEAIGPAEQVLLLTAARRWPPRLHSASFSPGGNQPAFI